jgi:predicted patatin/cPLA2 family phospholipase
MSTHAPPHDHPVLALLRERIAAASRPGSRRDPYKFGLAIEGGGMRGVVSCAMAAELAALGAYDAFDAVYGTSAGAFAGAFYVARQMHLGPPMYFDDLANRQFISWGRLLSKKPVLNLEFLVEHGLVRLKPLDWHHVADAAVRLKVVVSSLKEGRARVISEFHSRHDLLDALRASATVPYLAGPPVRYHDDLLFDGGVFEPIPTPSALADGCSHVLVLRSRPQGRYCTPPSPLASRVVEARLRKLSAATADAFVSNPRIYRHLAQEIEHATVSPASAPHLCGIVLPAGTPEITRLEKNRARLKAGAEVGALMIRTLLLRERPEQKAA